MLDKFPDIGLPDWGLSAESDSAVSVIKLGDGYEVRRPEGLNHVQGSWSMGWSSLDPLVAEDTLRWLSERKDWKAFEWIHPLDSSKKKVICTSVSLSHSDYGASSLNARFRQDFNPV